MIIEKERMRLEEYINCKYKFKKLLMLMAVSKLKLFIRLVLEMVFVCLYMVSASEDIKFSDQ